MTLTCPLSNRIVSVATHGIPVFMISFLASAGSTKHVGFEVAQTMVQVSIFCVAALLFSLILPTIFEKRYQAKNSNSNDTLECAPDEALVKDTLN